MLIIPNIFGEKSIISNISVRIDDNTQKTLLVSFTSIMDWNDYNHFASKNKTITITSTIKYVINFNVFSPSVKLCA